MILPIVERVTMGATLLFDVEDRYARDQGMRGPHPRPIEPLRFWLVGQVVGGARTDFPAPWELIVSRNAGGYHLLFDRVRFFGSASFLRRRLALGQYVVRITSEMDPIKRSGRSGQGLDQDPSEITSEMYQWVEREDIVLPMPDPGAAGSGTPYVFTLEPGFAYPFPTSVPVKPSAVGGCTSSPMSGQGGPTLLRGALHEADGRGIARATVQATGQVNSYTTDSSGRWVLVFDNNQPTGMVTVQVTRPGGSTVVVQNVCVMRGCETSLPETALRGWALQAGVGVHGATVQVSGQPVAVKTEVDGNWIYYFGLNQAASDVDVTATLPGGPSLTVHNVHIQPHGTVLVPTFRFS